MTNHPTNENAALSYARFKTLNDRHKLVAIMQIAGARNKDICAQLGYEPTTISQIQADPTFQLYKREKEKERDEQSLFDINQAITNLGSRPFDAMVSQMDQLDNMSIRHSATKELLDRQSPKINRSESINATIFHFESETVDNALKAMMEATGTTNEEIEGKSSSEVCKLLEAKLDEGT